MSQSAEREDMWRHEAEAAVSDIRKHVRSAAVCEEAGEGACLLLTTLEGRQYRVQVSAAGWQVLAADTDTDTDTDHAAPVYYETVYALLNTISQKYRDSFGGELMSRLLDLAKQTKR